MLLPDERDSSSLFFFFFFFFFFFMKQQIFLADVNSHAYEYDDYRKYVRYLKRIRLSVLSERFRVVECRKSTTIF